MVDGSGPRRVQFAELVRRTAPRPSADDGRKVLLRNLSGAASDPLGKAASRLRAYVAWAVLFSAGVNILYLTPTLYMMQVYDRVVPTGGVTTLLLVSIVAVMALAVLSFLDWLRGRVLLKAGLRLERSLAREILLRVIDAPDGQARKQAMREFDHVRTAVSGQAALAVFDLPWTPLYLACCFILHPAIGLLTLVGAGVLLALARLNERDSRSRLAQAIKASNAAYVEQDTIANQAEVVRALGMRHSLIDLQISHRNTAVSGQAGAQLAGGKYSSAIKFVRLLLQSTALGLAALMVIKGQMSPGAIIASSVLLSRSVAPIELLVGAWPSLVQARSSWTTLGALFAQTEEPRRDRTVLPAPAGALTLEEVSVQLPQTRSKQLDAVSFKLSPGETLGIIGASGSGKTTLARVIAGALRPTEGVIRLDGAEYDARDSDDLARHIGYLPQVSSLFAGSIRDNISRFERPDAEQRGETDLRVVEAAKAAGAHDLVQGLPEGYDTRLGPYGAGLSAGQAQRIALARALYRAPALLVLDEPNSNLDQEGEAALMTAVLAAAQRGAAVVIVAHRAGILARVDRLLVMRGGRVQLTGPREEVFARLRENMPRRPAKGAALS